MGMMLNTFPLTLSSSFFLFDGDESLVVVWEPTLWWRWLWSYLIFVVVIIPHIVVVVIPHICGDDDYDDDQWSWWHSNDGENSFVDICRSNDDDDDDDDDEDEKTLC